MSSGHSQESSGAGGGCAAAFVAILVLGAIVAALVSLAALIDPFDWMPTAGEMWEDCEDDWDTDGDECAWNNRFPGIWVHSVVNLVYVGAAAGLLLWVVTAVGELRGARAERLSDAGTLEHYVVARQSLATASVWTGLVAVLPSVVAIL